MKTLLSLFTLIKPATQSVIMSVLSWVYWQAGGCGYAVKMLCIFWEWETGCVPHCGAARAQRCVPSQAVVLQLCSSLARLICPLNPASVSLALAAQHSSARCAWPGSSSTAHPQLSRDQEEKSQLHSTEKTLLPLVKVRGIIYILRWEKRRIVIRYWIKAHKTQQASTECHAEVPSLRGRHCRNFHSVLFPEYYSASKFSVGKAENLLPKKITQKYKRNLPYTSWNKPLKVSA